MGIDKISFTSEESKYNSNVYERDNVVKNYTEDNKMQYPYLMLEADKVEMFRVEAMKGMLTKPTFLGVEDAYHVYLRVQNQIIGVGLLKRRYLKGVLTNAVFGTFKKTIYLDENTKFEGDMLFALCVPDVEVI